ncbi:MAG: ribulose-phosphate 3-epimerase [Bacteroidia bacterium]
MMYPQLYPSILSSDFSNLQLTCEYINNSLADAFHLDVMDGVFVPNISFGFPVVKAIKKHTKKPLDVHLMIVRPDNYIQKFKAAGADTLTVHLEATNNIKQTILSIKETGMKCCIAIKPATEVALLEDFIALVDSICVMSVDPGFGGQKFIESTYTKIENLKNVILTKKLKVLIKVDGGINLNNHKKVVNAGADILVVGSAIFDSNNPVEQIKILKSDN